MGAQEIKGSLTSDLDFKCARCLVTARPVDGRLVKEMMIGDETWKLFRTIWDRLSAGGGCELASNHVVSVPGVSFARFFFFLLIAIYLYWSETVSIQPVSDALCCMLLKHGL